MKGEVREMPKGNPGGLSTWPETAKTKRAILDNFDGVKTQEYLELMDEVSELYQARRSSGEGNWAASRQAWEYGLSKSVQIARREGRAAEQLKYADVRFSVESLEDQIAILDIGKTFVRVWGMLGSENADSGRAKSMFERATYEWAKKNQDKFFQLLFKVLPMKDVELLGQMSAEGRTEDEELDIMEVLAELNADSENLSVGGGL